MTLRSFWRWLLRNWLVRRCWNWNKECIAEEGQEERKLQEKKKKNTKFTVRGVAEVFADLNKLLKKCEARDPYTPKGFH